MSHYTQFHSIRHDPGISLKYPDAFHMLQKQFVFYFTVPGSQKGGAGGSAAGGVTPGAGGAVPNP